MRDKATASLGFCTLMPITARPVVVSGVASGAHAMKRSLAFLALLTVMTVPARADRPVTEAERSSLVPAVAAQGCTGGKMQCDDDDREFEVDDVQVL
jgi:hypothetical protein